MIAKLKAFFERELSTQENVDPEQQLKKACVALLLEVARADMSFAQDELEHIQLLVQKEFGLTLDEVNQFISLLEEEGASMHPFTSLINEHYQYQQKVSLTQQLWSVAFSDGELSKYEDAAIRKIADLLYVRHSDFIKTKLSQS